MGSHGTSCKSTAAVINTHSAHKGVSFAEVRVDIYPCCGVELLTAQTDPFCAVSVQNVN